MESRENNITRGMIVYHLNSKRIRLQQIQHLTSILYFPVKASRGDLEVMICGKLIDMDHDATNVQIIITQCENGEELSLRDLEETFLVAPVLPYLARISKERGRERLKFNHEEEAEDFTVELTLLQDVLQSLESITYKTSVHRGRGHTIKTKFSEANERLVEPQKKRLNIWEQNLVR